MADTHLHVLGIDIGGTKSAVLIGSGSSQIVAREQWATVPSPEEMIDRAVTLGQRLIDQHGSPVTRVGVSIGGPLDGPAGIIHAPPNLPRWDGVPLKAILEERLKRPVNVLHDAAACAMAEYRWGSAERPKRMAYLTCGTGLGVGLVFDGKPYIGANGRFPELGHARLTPDGPAAFGKVGSIEAWCSGSGLPAVAAHLFPGRWKNNPPGGPALSELAQAGDADARTVLRTNAQQVGRVCALLGDLLLLDRIVLGSLSQYLGEWWIAEVRSTFTAEVLLFVADHCSIVTSTLGPRLQDLSAIAAALNTD